MDTKKMTVANLNVVFGEQEEPMVYHIDDVIIPALTSGIFRKSGQNTRFLFNDVMLRKFYGEYVLCGLVIKDTVLEIQSEYNDEVGLTKTVKSMQSAPYSLFMIYLKNHRMVLVKNQKGSPDIRSFKSTFSGVMHKYISLENKYRKKENTEMLLRPKNVAVTGIKTRQSIKEVLKDVEKIEQVTMKFFPLNGEWDMDYVIGPVNNVRKKLESKTGRMVFNSPKNMDAVAEYIEKSEGLVETQMKVRYSDNGRTYEKHSRRATIKDSQISEDMNIDIKNDLKDSYEEVYACKKDILSLQQESKNNVVYYEEFLKRRKKLNE